MVYGSFNRDPAGSESQGESIAEALPARSRLNLASTPEPTMNIPARFALVVIALTCGALSNRPLIPPQVILWTPRANSRACGKPAG